jgi:hypothetical protein
MAELSWWWSSNHTGDGAHTTQSELFAIWTAFFGDGVVADPGDGLDTLLVTGTTSPVSVATGWAVVGGSMYRNSAISTSLTITTPAVQRAYRIVLRADYDAQTVRLVAVAGTDGTTTPPALVQSATYPSGGQTWEISLATLVILSTGAITVTDTRTYALMGCAITTINIANLAVTTAKLNDAAVTYAKMAADAKAACSVIQQATVAATLQSTTASWVDFITSGDITVAASPIHPGSGGHIQINAKVCFEEGGSGEDAIEAQLLVDGTVRDSATSVGDWGANKGTLPLQWVGDIANGTKVVKVQIRKVTGPAASCTAVSKLSYLLFS